MTTTIHLTADNFNESRDFFNHRDPLPENLRDMTQERWNLLSNAQREAMRDNSHLSGNRPAGALVIWKSRRLAPRAVIPLGLAINPCGDWRKSDEHF